MTEHIGIVACSAEGAALCYRTIYIEGAAILGKYAHSEVTIHTHPFNEYMRYIETDDWNGVADLIDVVLSKESCARGRRFRYLP